jgi:hypothetical protein
MYLNSLWGKFGQRDDLVKTEYFRADNVTKYFNILSSDKCKLQGPPLIITEDLLLMSYKEKRDFLRKSYRTNLYVAEFTTSWARLRLYAMLERVGDSLVYCDTDSVVYIADDETEKKVNEFIGNSLGQFQDELQGGLIIYWVAIGPKDYSFVKVTNKSDGSIEIELIGKTKGLRSDGQYDELVRKDVTTLKTTREAQLKGKIKKKIQQIFKLEANHDIIVGEVTKEWQCTFDKRIPINKADGFIDSVPYGYY